MNFLKYIHSGLIHPALNNPYTFHKETQIWTGRLEFFEEQRGELLHPTMRTIQKRKHAIEDEASQLNQNAITSSTNISESTITYPTQTEEEIKQKALLEWI